jgi:hypothetical protein
MAKKKKPGTAVVAPQKTKAVNLSDARLRMILGHVKQKEEGIAVQLGHLMRTAVTSETKEAWEKNKGAERLGREVEMLQREQAKRHHEFSMLDAEIEEEIAKVRTKYSQRKAAIETRRAHLSRRISQCQQLEGAIRSLSNCTVGEYISDFTETLENYDGKLRVLVRGIAKKIRSRLAKLGEAGADRKCAFSDLETLLICGGTSSGIERVLMLLPDAQMLRGSTFDELSDTMSSAVKEVRKVQLNGALKDLV